MDRNYKAILKMVLAHEGGWADNPKDPGGATMKGVTLAMFRKAIKKDATKAELRAITTEQLEIVYRRHFWDPIVGAELPDGIDYAVFDFGVNSGPSRAVKYLQRVVGVVQDGRVGPKTLAAVRSLSPAVVINRLCDERLAFMKVAKNRKTGEPLWPTFGRGWSARVQRVRGGSISMAAANSNIVEQLPAKPAKDAVVVTAPGPKPGTTTVVVTPKPETKTQSTGVSKTGWTAIGSILVAIGAMLSSCFSGE